MERGVEKRTLSAFPRPPSLPPTVMDGPPSRFPDVPGARIECGSELPYSGAAQYALRVHDCWYVSLEDGRSEYFFAGTEEEDRAQGVLGIIRANVPPTQGGRHYSRLIRTPGRWGEPIIFFARWEMACFQTPANGVGALDAAKRIFLTRSSVIDSCRAHLK